MADDFSKFGNNFQTLLTGAMLRDKAFFEQIYEILQIPFFSSEPHQHIIGEITNYFNKYLTIPTFENLEIIINQTPEETLKQEAYQVLVSARSSTINDLAYIKDQAIEFCRNQAMKSAILESVSLLERNKYEEITTVVEKALQAGDRPDLGHDYFKDVESRTDIKKRTGVTTGWPKIDELLDGGHGHGELGVIIAPTGGGKSFVLMNLGYGALVNGKNVVHYTFELGEETIGLRYDSRITGFPINEIKKYSDVVAKKLSAFEGGKLIIKEYPIKSASVNTIRFHLNRLRATGFHPDLIIVDYADIMKSRKNYEIKRYELESIYEDLRALAQEMKLPIWTASQTNRSAIDEEIITLGSIAEAYSKAAVSDFIFSLSRKLADKINNTGRFYIAKNRNGMDGVIIPLKVNTSIGLIEIEETSEMSQVKHPAQMSAIARQDDDLSGQILKDRLTSIKQGN